MTDTTILNFHRLSQHDYLVLLACGHSYTIPVTDLSRLGLFIGKRLTCHECERKHYEAQHDGLGIYPGAMEIVWRGQ